MTVLRDGRGTRISTYDLLVGDILQVGTGDILAADGLFFEANDVRSEPLLLCQGCNGAPSRLTSAGIGLGCWQSSAWRQQHSGMPPGSQADGRRSPALDRPTVLAGVPASHQLL